MKKLILPLATLTVILILAFGYSLMNKSEDTTLVDSNQVANQGEQAVGELVAEWQKVGQAIAAGRAISCQMKNSETDETMQYYVKGNKMRIDSNNPANPDQAGSLLFDGEFSYTWTADSTQGMKFALKREATASAAPSETMGQAPVDEAPDLSQQSVWETYQNSGFVVTCDVEREVDPTLFVPPANIEFLDLSSFSGFSTR